MSDGQSHHHIVGEPDDRAITPIPVDEIRDAIKASSSYRRIVHNEAKLLVSLGYWVLPVAQLEKGYPKKEFNANSASRNPKQIDEWFHPDKGKFAGFNLANPFGSDSTTLEQDNTAFVGRYSYGFGESSYVGGLLTTLSLGLLSYALLEAPRHGFDARILTVGFSGLGALGLFFVWESRCPDPLLSPDLFRSRQLRGAAILTMLVYSAWNGLLFFLPLNLIQIQGYLPTAAGLSQLPEKLAP